MITAHASGLYAPAFDSYFWFSRTPGKAFTVFGHADGCEDPVRVAECATARDAVRIARQHARVITAYTAFVTHADGRLVAEVRS